MAFLPAALVLLALVAGFSAMAGCAGGPTRASTGEYIDDSVVTSKVKTALFRDPDVSGFQVSVETHKGQVQLSGFVDTPEQKARAERVARSVEGVRSVTNSIIVKPR
ncbi:transporter [Sulfurifustis variabilis]|uniref:Osmotically-inducible protein Y n=1 Tax=Sulfurifustis variabilis TaxID=1675686 RepID=A0A1B4VC74_9GAMM|nr:BON domain-containing protein [Sulfurifustis variabilis]BAU48851.1 transporter [Sulfurifustis variabilis]